jgi:hypothetical protein
MDNGMTSDKDEIITAQNVLIQEMQKEIEELKKRLADREAEVESLSYRLYNGRH